MAIDNTTGEVKLVRGSGPPILTVEEHPIGITDTVYGVNANAWSPTLPMQCRVIGIDLTRRTVRLQVVNGREIVYSADDAQKSQVAFLCESAETAKKQAIAVAQKAVKMAEQKADAALVDLEKAKTLLSKAQAWGVE